MTSQVVAVLGEGVVPADRPVLRADDPGVLGNGLFETLHVRAGRPWLLDEHLARMSAGAASLGLVVPAGLAELALTACAAWPAEVEGALRLVCTPLTAFCLVTDVPPRVLSLRVATRPGPGTLAGVKSLSYGDNLATRRWATANEVDDVLWVSPDGYALEGPTANLVWLDRDVLCTVPASAGVLPGITAAWLLGQAGALGWRAEHRMIRPASLVSVDGGVWLTSSVRGLAEVRTLDGVDLPPSPHTDQIRAHLGFPEGG